MSPPGIHAESALAPHLRDVVPVQNLEHEPEALFHLGLPLLQHRRRRGHDDGLDLAPQQEFARDQAGFDRLAEAGVVRDEEVHAREAQRFS